MWSLGITCIELAEMKPPRYGEDPTKAMNEIPRAPPPKLTEPEKWTPAFHAMLELLLNKDPTRRPTCKELLRHEWMTTVADNGAALLVEYIRKVKKLEDQFEPPAAVLASGAQSPSAAAAPGSPPSAPRQSPERRPPAHTVGGDLTRTPSQGEEAPLRRSNRGETVTSPRTAVVAAAGLISAIGKKAKNAITGDDDDDPFQTSPRGNESVIPELQKVHGIHVWVGEWAVSGVCALESAVSWVRALFGA